MDVVDRIAQLLFDRLVRIIAAELPIFVHGAGDDAHVELLGLLRLAIGVEGQALLRAIGQPLLQDESVALGLGELIALLVEEHLVIEAFGRAASQPAAIVTTENRRVWKEWGRQ